MDFGMEAGIFLAYTAGLMLIYFFGKILIVPIKSLIKLLFNVVMGGILIVVINLIGGFAGLSVPVNFITVFIAGLLGVPGIAGLLIYFSLF